MKIVGVLEVFGSEIFIILLLLLTYLAYNSKSNSKEVSILKENEFLSIFYSVNVEQRSSSNLVLLALLCLDMHS